MGAGWREPLLSAWTGRKDSACPWGIPCPLKCPAQPASLSPSHHPVPPHQGRMAQKRDPSPQVCDQRGLGGRLVKCRATCNRVCYSLIASAQSATQQPWKRLWCVSCNKNSGLRPLLLGFGSLVQSSSALPLRFKLWFERSSD